MTDTLDDVAAAQQEGAGEPAMSRAGRAAAGAGQGARASSWSARTGC